MTGHEQSLLGPSPLDPQDDRPQVVLATASADFPVNMDALRQGLGGAAVARAVGLPVGPMSADEEDAAALVLGDADGILVRVGYLGPRLIAMLPRLQVVTLHGSGVDQVAVGACLAHGITVTNTPGANAAAVAELTVGLMLAVLRRIPMADTRLRAGDWAAGRAPTEELAGKVVGVIGLGRIGRRVANLARAFGATVVTHTRTPQPESPNTPLEQLLVMSDIVTLHVPLMPATNGMLDSRRLALMKDRSVLINTARGALVDETALAAALSAGRLAGAGLDVFCSEPPDPGNPLLRLANVVVTPHMGSSTRQALEAIAKIAGEDLARVLGGQPPRYPVTLET